MPQRLTLETPSKLWSTFQKADAGEQLDGPRHAVVAALAGAGALISEVKPVLAEADSAWSRYRDGVRTVLSAEGKITVRATGDNDTGIQSALVTAIESGATVDIAPLLVPGTIIRRHRPRDTDGKVVDYPITKPPRYSSPGSSEGDWRFSVVSPAGGGMNLSIDDLLAPPDPANGRSWELVVPEVRPAPVATPESAA